MNQARTHKPWKNHYYNSNHILTLTNVGDFFTPLLPTDKSSRQKRCWSSVTLEMRWTLHIRLYIYDISPKHKRGHILKKKKLHQIQKNWSNTLHPIRPPQINSRYWYNKELTNSWHLKHSLLNEKSDQDRSKKKLKHFENWMKMSTLLPKLIG